MKKLLLLALTLTLTLSLAFSLAACGDGGNETPTTETVTMDGLRAKCEKLKAEGKIANYEIRDYAVIAVNKKAEYFTAQECDDEEAAIERYNRAAEEMKDRGEAASKYVLKRFGNIVVMAESQELYDLFI